MRPILMLPALLLMVTVACDRKEKAQEERAAADIKAMTAAVTKGEPLPPLPSDPEVYGRGRELMVFMHDRLSRAVLTNNEMQALSKGAEHWIEPQEWTSPARVKELRNNAQRMITLVEQSSQLMEDCVGAPGLAKIQAMDLRPGMKRGVLKGLQVHEDTYAVVRELMEATHGMFEKRLAILALADDKGVKVEEGVPKFPTSEDAVRYRTLVQEEQGEIQRLRNIALRFQSKAAELATQKP